MVQFKQIELLPILQRHHHRVVAGGPVATYQFRSPVGRQGIENFQQSRLGILGGVLVAGADFDPRHLSQSSHQVGVIGVQRTSGLSWVVADDRSFLVTVKSLDGGVGIQNPWRSPAASSLGAQLSM